MVPDTLGKHGRTIGGETGKGHGGAYKLRLSYHLQGMDRGGQSRSGASGQPAGRRQGQRDKDSQPAQPYSNQRLTSRRTDPHPTRVAPTLLLARASDP